VKLKTPPPTVKKNTEDKRVSSNYRFSQKTVNTLQAESSRQRRTKTAIMELAFAYYMSTKAENRDKIRFAL